MTIATAPALPAPRPAPRWRWLVAAVAAIFGVASVVSGGRVLFGPEAARLAAGQVVPFVLWFNFGAGFAYVAAAAGLALARRWGARLALGIFAATALVQLAFIVHALGGGAFEARTAVAMALRTTTWALIAAVSCRRFGCLGGRS